MKKLIIILIIMSSIVVGQISSFIPEERVATLKNQMEEAGYYRIRWNGKNMSNIPLPSGMYIIQMTAKSMEDGELFTKAQKVVLLK